MPTGQSSKQPNSFADGVQTAMQALAAAMAAPDADLHFGSEMIKVLGTFLQMKGKMTPSGAPAGPPGGGGPGGGPGGPGSPAGMPLPGGAAGGGAANPTQPNMAGPAGPMGGGPTPGLTPNPDDMRRVMQEVAGQ